MLKWMPQRGVLSPLHLPPNEEQIEGSPYQLVFDFSGEGVLATDSQSLVVNQNFLVEKITASCDAPAGTFQFQLYHQHGSVQRQLFSEALDYRLVSGTGPAPNILKSPYLLAAGDTITADIANLGKTLAGAYAGCNIEIVLHGVHV
jgi:hypothetical protein